MHEQRRGARKRTLKAARIAFDDQRSTVDCTVHHLTGRSASVKVETTTGIPDRFTLVMEGEGHGLPRSVIWRLPQQMGVRFGKT